ncbi:MAG: tetratricopeptide repeat protein [bacterium]|nr:tetratricopeptide repeat protein [bacterium]
MKKYIAWLAVVLIVALGAAVATGALWLWSAGEAEWTTCSNAARKEFVLGLDDFERYYHVDAAAHFQRAIDLDPEFAAAKLFLSDRPPSEEVRNRLLAELREVDPDSLTPRESFLVTYWVARHRDEDARAREILDSFLDEYPEDLFGLRAVCEAAWDEENWTEAERCYARGIKLYPNWVSAQNRLGYIAMAQGRFTQAEEHFRTYRYIAPDQANPYDSLGELLTTLGRDEEAEEAFREAIRIKEDFCAAYRHLATLYVLSGRVEEITELLHRIETVDSCAELSQAGLVCGGRAFVSYLRGDLEEAWRLMEGECLERLDGFELVAHRLAVMTGRPAAAEEMEGKRREDLAREIDHGHTAHADQVRADLLHAEAVRLLAAGDHAAATERLFAADELLKYWNVDRASFKLFNRLTLVYSLRLEGRTGKAKAMIKKIEAVNPRFAEARLPDMEALLEAEKAGP